MSQLIDDYAKRFPAVLNYLATNQDKRQDALNAYAKDPDFVRKVLDYLSELPTAKVRC